MSEPDRRRNRASVVEIQLYHMFRPLFGRPAKLDEFEARALAITPRAAMISAMTEAEIAKLATWLAKAGLKDAWRPRSSRAFASGPSPAACRSPARSCSSTRLHPIYEGRVFRWEREPARGDASPNTAAAPRARPPSAGARARLPPAGETANRCCAGASPPTTKLEFPMFPELRDASITEYRGDHQPLRRRPARSARWIASIPHG